VEGWLPFWSPDGRSIAYFTLTELRRIDLERGEDRRICTYPEGFVAGGEWLPDGAILFSAGGLNARIYTVSANGGEPRPVLPLDASRGETAHLWPKVLPDGRSLLFQVAAPSENAGLFLGSLDDPGRRQRLLPTPTRAEYHAGHLLFVRDRTLYAQRLDLESATLSGEPIPLASPVASWKEAFGWGWFNAGTGGWLAYLEGGRAPESQLVWFDRNGTRLGVVGEPGPYNQVSLSPDETLVAVDRGTAADTGRDIWTVDLARGVWTRQTSDPAEDADPVWSPDGRELVFVSNRGGSFRLYRKSLASNEPESPVERSPDGAFPDSWSRDGRWLFYHRNARSVGALPLTDRGAPETIVDRGYGVDEPQISPDGRWLAFVSMESGWWSVDVLPFGRTGERIRVAPTFAGQPKWRSDGRELFYVEGGELLAVEVRESSGRLTFSRPVKLLQGLQDYYGHDAYAPTRDGRRFLAIVPTASREPERVRVLANWTSLLEEKGVAAR
jgi:Tol biopolymer transport system component